MDIKALLTTPVIWFLIGLVFLLLELIVPGLVIVFFGVGAWITALSCVFFDIDINIQILIFTVSSVLSLALLRNYLKRRFFKEDTNQEGSLDEEFIGKTAIVKTPIKPGIQGKVSFKGTQWEAESDQSIDEGTRVRITGKDSIILKVEPLKMEE
ncbi:MAG: NfeD family protein [Bacteroidales bacterium]|nr:MAG: NfeD family protein [Bacteroidales bacterium]